MFNKLLIKSNKVKLFIDTNLKKRRNSGFIL